MARTSRTSRAAGLVALVAAALLAGCGVLGGDDAAPPDAGTEAPSPSASAGAPPAPPATAADPTADDARAAGTPVDASGRTVLHALPGDGGALATGADAADPDVTVVRVDPGASGGPVSVVLAAPAGGRLEALGDGSFVVHAADGAPLGGGPRPATADDGPPVTVTPLGGDALRASADGGVLEVRVGGRAVLSTDWGEREGGRSIAVEPATWARTAGQAGEIAVWAELVALEPEVDAPVMRDQLTCHALGAPTKATWNLEPWRPDVGLLRVLAAGCNPE